MFKYTSGLYSRLSVKNKTKLSQQVLNQVTSDQKSDSLPTELLNQKL